MVTNMSIEDFIDFLPPQGLTSTSILSTTPPPVGGWVDVGQPLIIIGTLKLMVWKISDKNELHDLSDTYKVLPASRREC